MLRSWSEKINNRTLHCVTTCGKLAKVNNIITTSVRQYLIALFLEINHNTYLDRWGSVDLKNGFERFFR